MTMDEMDQVVDGVSAGAPFRLRNRSTVITEAPRESLIFDMAFVLPPMIEMTEVEKDMPIGTLSLLVPVATGFCWLEN
tara:strand:+ start:104 stop:337 length:234 start_codon:yes stop_codon:yes gene_type:complete